MNWLTLKAKLYTAAAALLTILGLILRNRYLADKAERQKHRAEVAEAKVRHDKAVREQDDAIEQEFSRRADEANKDKRDGQVPDNFGDPDNW